MNRLSSKSLFLIIIALILLYFSTLPLCVLLVKCFSQNAFNLSLFSDDHVKKAFLHTLLLCLYTTLLSIVIGVPLAWVLSSTDIPKKKLFRSLFAIPYILPPYVACIAWIKLLNPTSGVLNQYVIQHLHFTQPLFNIYSLKGSAWVLGFIFFSFIFFACSSALEKMNPTFEEASLLSGASQCQTFFNIILPLLTPALVGGIILVFISTVAAFGVPALLMSASRQFVLTTKIYNDLLSYGDGIFRAAALSTLLIIFSLTGLLLNTYFLRKKKFITVSGQHHQKIPFALKKLKWPIFLGMVVIWFIMVGLPLITVVISSFLKVYGDPFSFSNLSIKKYIYVLSELTLTKKAFVNSFLFSSLAASASVAIGMMIAYLKTKTTLPGKNVVDFLATLPFGTPGGVIAIAFIISFSGLLGLNLYNTLWILVTAYAVKYISFGIRNIAAQFDQIDTTLEEAARMSGAGWFYAFRTTLLVIAKPTIMASWFLIFMSTFAELTMSIFLVGPETHTVGTLLFNLQSYDDPQSAAVLGTLIVMVILTTNMIVKKLSKGAYGV